MVGQRIKTFRQARGLSLEELAAAAGGIVTKQAISKYETGKDQPSVVVLSRLAKALRVQTVDLLADSAVRVEFVAFRKGSSLLRTEQHRVESRVTEELEHRVRLQEVTGQTGAVDVPLNRYPVAQISDAEDAARDLRQHWKLGVDPISSVTGLLEDHFVHVLELEASEKFDGISAVAYKGSRPCAAAVVSRRGVAGERQRFNLVHELAHLVLNIDKRVNEEKAAHRFGSAFLAPQEVLRREVGDKRVFIPTDELLLLKQSIGMSIQAILYRLHDLGIITKEHFVYWCKSINRLGWRKKEPSALEPEQPQWLNRTVLRAVAEGQLGRDEAERILGHSVEQQIPLSLVERKAFLRLPLEQRRRIMAEQAQKFEDYYRQVVARGEIEVADSL